MKVKILTSILFFSFMAMSAQYKVFSESKMGKKTVILTKYDRGFVVKNNNEKLNGSIQLKIVNNDTVEVRYKNEAKKKTKFKREDLKKFGLTSLVSDNRVAKNPAKNFNNGYVITNTGEKKAGKIALRFSLNPGETIGRKWFVYKVLFAKGNGEYLTYTAKDLEEVSQNIAGTNSLYVRYKDGFTKLIDAGSLELFQNPYSTSENSMVTGLIKEVQQDLAEEAAKQTLRTAIKTGNGSIEDVKNNYDAVNSANVSVSRKEYLIRSKGGDSFQVLSKDNYKTWSQSFFNTCNAFTSLSSKEQKKLTKWANLVEGITFYNKNCN